MGVPFDKWQSFGNLRYYFEVVRKAFYCAAVSLAVQRHVKCNAGALLT
jgi:hypothetical protein